MANITGPQAMAYGGGQEFTFGYPEGTSIIDIQPDYMKAIIDPHWAKFPPVNPMWHYVLGLLYIFIVFFAVTGNFLVIWLFNKHAPLRTPSNFLVVNLALSDLIMMTTNCPFFIWNCFHGGVWSMSIEYCSVYAALGAVTGVCSIWTLACISADRFNIICNGFNGPKLTKGKASVMALWCWTLSCTIASLPFFGWGSYGPEGILTSCSFDYISQDIGTITYNLFMFIFNYCCPLLIIVGSYAMIVKAIFAHEEAMRAQAAKMNVKSLRSAEANEQRAEIRIAKTAIFNIALWIICWTPYAAITLQGCVGRFDHLKPLTTTLPALLAKSASCYNPFVYAIGHPRFRQAMTIHMPWFCVHENTPQADNQSAATATEEKA
uniref:Opsin 3 n=1 Tax=Euphausia superba TaxID=6819 RepID=A0A142BLS8_EUPSU|nr:opsin 3 [Euphausia superba]